MVGTKEMLLRIAVAVIVVPIFLSGCNVTFPQVNGVVDWYKTEILVPSSEAEEEIRWTASINNQGRVMTAYFDPEARLTIFISDSNDAIAFDGWVVRSLIGFGFNDVISVIDRGSLRTFQNGGSFNRTDCAAWQRSIQSTMTIWRQSCNSTDQDNVLEVNSIGEITFIEQEMTGSGERLVLNKL